MAIYILRGFFALISGPIIDLGFKKIQYHHKIQEGGCKEIQDSSPLMNKKGL
jgi:hypothetical protein